MLLSQTDSGPPHIVEERAVRIRSAKKKRRLTNAGTESAETFCQPDIEAKLHADANDTEPNGPFRHSNLAGNNNAHKANLTPQATAGGVIILNIAGNKYETYTETLEKFPQSLLGDPFKRQQFLNPSNGEYFFDRHRGAFESILYFYQSEGYLRRPANIPVDVFVEEILFFELGDEVMEKFWEAEGYKKPAEPPLPNNVILRRIWLLMEYPDSSIAARICAFLSVFVIIISTLSFCLETVDTFQTYFQTNDPTPETAPRNSSSASESASSASHQRFRSPFFMVEIGCILWFTIEFLLRLLSCPSKCEFCKSFLNWVDFLAIAPFFINLAFRAEESSATPFLVLRVLRLVRVFRIFKLSRHSRGLQILGMTFKASLREFFLLCFFLLIAIVLFSSAMYFAESIYEEEDKKSDFPSIPDSFWYSIVTMTTIGYGDMVPKTSLGKLVGSVCAIVGVLVIALPVPVIVENFKHFYRQENRLARVHYLRNLGASGEPGKCGKVGATDNISNISAES